MLVLLTLDNRALCTISILTRDIFGEIDKMIKVIEGK